MAREGGSIQTLSYLGRECRHRAGRTLAITTDPILTTAFILQDMKNSVEPGTGSQVLP